MTTPHVPHDCPCNVKSPRVCAYANSTHICNGRPDMRITNPEEWAALIAFFKSQGKGRKKK